MKIEFYQIYMNYPEPYTEKTTRDFDESQTYIMPCLKCQSKGGFNITPSIWVAKTLGKEDHIVSCKNEDCDNKFIMRVCLQGKA